MNDFSHKFEDSDLQRRLISGLQELTPPPAYSVESDGTVSCDEDAWLEVNAVIHAIRRSCFRWYLRWSDDLDWSAAFQAALQRSGTPFQIEYHNQRMAFLVPREHEQLHEKLSFQASMEIDPFRKIDASRDLPPRPRRTIKSPLITFEKREIPAYAQFVRSDQLTIGETYFHVSYIDLDMLIPTVSSLVYIGKNFGDDEVSTLYFQDVDSYFAGLRITDENPDPDSMRFESWREDGFAGVYEFEYALEDLMRCSLRRKKGLKPTHFPAAIDGPLHLDAFLQCNGTPTPCSIHVSEPIGSADGDFHCLVRLPPILNDERKIFGADAAQARELAIRFLEQITSGMSIVDGQGEALDWTNALGK